MKLVEKTSVVARLWSWFLTGLLLTSEAATGAASAADDDVDYLTQIKPLLRERCFSCHGALRQEADLRLDTARSMIEHGVVSPGEPSASLILERVEAADPAERMPPEHEGEPLSAEQVTLLATWIEQGANVPGEQPDADPREHWAFRPVQRPAVPDVANRAWVRNPIDAFVARQHEQQGLVPQEEAPRLILLRRLYFDLLGVPPTVEEIAAVQSDSSLQWYDHTVERLLSDPRYGERWGRHWMDIWRYSDWWGLGQQHRNSQKHIWHWRDWIIESLNDDMPYDEMVRLMLAADEMHPNDLDKLRATGYLARNYFLFNRNQWMEETVEHVGKAFLGLTINCAKCHDHKYDPIEQDDFYRMRAFFEPYHVRLDMLPGEDDLARNGIPRVFDGKADVPTYLFIRGDEKNPDKSAVMEPGVPVLFADEVSQIEPVALPATAWQPELRPWVTEAHLAAADQQVRSAEVKLAGLLKKLAAKREEATAASGHDLDAAASKGLSDEDRAEQRLAEAELALAHAERVSVEKRNDAMRAEYALDNCRANEKRADLEQARDEKKAGAVRAERDAAVARAAKDLAAAELGLLRTAEDKKEEAEKTLTAARETLEKATMSAAAEIAPTDSYTRLVGAQWVATRFLSSGKDDPVVDFAEHSTGRRTALARWITARENPLTARVAINHLWTRHMGGPLVPTVFDFGRNGIRPVHPELVDWLAAEFMDNGWSMKHVHRLIVKSASYRMSSSLAGRERMAAKDPDNLYLWRRTPIRLESQAVRDAVLALSASLDYSMGGPPVLAAQQDSSSRRSLYFFHSNNDRNLFLTTFDEAAVKECYRREQSIVPQQALALTNSRLVLDASQRVAENLSKLVHDEPTFVAKAFAVVLGIDPGEAEMAAASNALAAWRELPGEDAGSARGRLVWALMNHNDFVTLR